MKKLLLLLELLALVAPARADFYWLLSGDLKNTAGQRSDRNGNGLGCWLELTNDVAGVDYNPVKVYDIRRKTTGGTDLVKWGEGSSVEPFPGCRYGEAVVDFSLPIRGADGTSYRLVQVSSYQGCNFLGKLVLTNSIASLDNQCFRNNYYLREVVMPDPATWQPTAITRAFEGCSRLESAIAWPDSLDKVSQYTFSGNSSMAGFSGKGVKTYEAGAFHSVPTTFRLEMSEADTISFTGQAINNNNISTVVWHGTPPSTGDYFSKQNNSFMHYSKTDRVHYIPYDDTQEGGVPAAWAAYKTAFEAEVSGNSLTFPTYDPATGTQTDGSWYRSGRSSNADKVRFWFPDDKAALLMK